MKSSEYWKERFLQLENAQHKKGADAMKEIEEIYHRAQLEIEYQIERWYQRFAKNNNITLAEARKFLSSSDLAELKWDVKEYIKHGEQNAMTGQWMKELENASAKYHISYYEALKIKTRQSLETLYSKQFGIVKNTMEDVYKSGYYHTAYELQKGFEIGWDIAAIDQRQIEKVINKPWAPDGKNFSERIWGNRQKLVNSLYNELTLGIILGQDPQKTISRIAKNMNVSQKNAGRLVMTEKAFFSSAAQKDCFNDLDVQEYKIVATLDSSTSDICRSFDGKHFPMKDYQPGVSAPPFHVWCRSITVPYFNDEFSSINKRAARNEKTGKVYYVPADMTYNEWQKAFVDGGNKEKYKADYLMRANTPGQDITDEKRVVNEAISEVPKKVQEALNNGTVIDIGKNGASQYDYNHDILYIAKGANKEAVIHEIGHMVENKMLDAEKVEALIKQTVGIVSIFDLGSDIFIDNAGNEKEVFFVKSDKFVSEYQGRIYVGNIFEAFESDGTFKYALLWEYVSEAFREFVEDPDALKVKDAELYDLIKEAVE